MKQIFQLKETNRIVRNQYELNLNVPKVNEVSYGEKRTPFRFISRLVKILKLSKTLKTLSANPTKW